MEPRRVVSQTGKERKLNTLPPCSLLEMEEQNTFLCIGDPHIRISNITDVDLFIERLETRVLSQRTFSGIVVLGDTLHDHERLHTIPLNKSIELFTRLSQFAPVKVLVGNHDLCNNQQFLTENHWLVALKSLPNITIVDTVVFDASTNTVFLPYVPNGRLQEALDTNNSFETQEVSAIFAHQEILGCVMGAFISEHGDEYPLENPALVSGHIHSNQQPQPNVYYPGSMLQHAFGESTRNVVAVVTVPKTVLESSIVVNADSPTSDRVTVEEIDLELPRKLTIYTTCDEFEGIIGRVPEEARHTRIVIEGTADQFKAVRKKNSFKLLKSRGAKLVFKSRVLELADSENQKTTDDFVTVLQESCGDNEGLLQLCNEVIQQTLMEQ